MAYDNYVAREVQGAIDRLEVDKEADAMVWRRDWAAKVLQRLYRTAKCRKALEKVRGMTNS